MLGYILFGYAVSVFVAYVFISEDWAEGEELWLRLVCAIFWPIVLLVNVLQWLVCRPILKPMWTFIGKGFVFLGRGIAFIGRGIGLVLKPIFRGLASLLGPVLKPIFRLISALWSRWINRWPEPKRVCIRTATVLAILYALLAIPSWLIGGRILAIVYWSAAAAALVVMLVIYLRLRKKQVNSS